MLLSPHWMGAWRCPSPYPPRLIHCHLIMACRSLFFFISPSFLKLWKDCSRLPWQHVEPPERVFLYFPPLQQFAHSLSLPLSLTDPPWTINLVAGHADDPVAVFAATGSGTATLSRLPRCHLLTGGSAPCYSTFHPTTSPPSDLRLLVPGDLRYHRLGR